MDIQISFQDGPIQADIQANEDEDYDEVLDALAEFVEGYGDLTGSPSSTSEGETESENIHSDDAKLDEFDSIKTNEGGTAESKEHPPDSLGNPFLAETGLTEDQLYHILKVGNVEGGDIDVFPRIITDTEVLGDTIQERLLHGSIIILSVLSDYHDIDKVKTSDLKQALRDSGMKAENFTNIRKLEEAEIYLNRRGSGKSATTEIRPPGKDKAYELVQRLSDQ